MEQANKLIYFFLLLLIGYSSGRIKLLPESVSKGISPVLMNLCYPAMIISTFSATQLTQILKSGMQIVLATLVINCVLILFAGYFLRKKASAERTLLQFMYNIGNITYVGIPLISIFLPESTLTLVVLHGSVQDFLIWLYFYPSFLASREKGGILQFLKNPCLIALLIGLLLMVFPVKLPVCLNMTLNSLSGMTTPLATLYLGLLISRYGVLASIKSIFAIRYSLIKVLLIPFLVFLCCLPILGIHISLLLALLYGCPAPLMSVIWAQQYDVNPKQTGSCCISSTLLFLLVASVVLFLYSRLSLI